VIYEKKLEKFEEDNFRKMEEEKEKLDKRLTVFQATLAVIASIIGGGIICIPYAMTTAGFINGAIINFIILVIQMYCTHLYMRAMDMFGLRSISELCYMCFGRHSVYIINGLLVFVFFGYLVMFEILFSNLATSIVLHSGLITPNGLI
jgi:sodium-coupled neutral amino acid transporter 11